MSEYADVTERGTLRIERLLPGPIERVWSYLTESDRRATWLAAGEMDLRVGGRVEHVFYNSKLTDDDDPPPAKYADQVEARMEGRITACDPPRLLAYTWGEASGRDSHVTFELTPRGDSVLLVVTHRQITTRDDMVGAAGGWHAHLGILADRLAGRTPTGFWRTHTRLEAEYEKRLPATLV